jgi:uncharacterized lipoprotein
MNRGMRKAGVLALAAALLLIASCSMVRKVTGSGKCREPVVPAAVENPPLRAPNGLDAPDTRNAIKVPVLAEPEKPRGKTDPCLSQPPSYGS